MILQHILCQNAEVLIETGFRKNLVSGYETKTWFQQGFCENLVLFTSQVLKPR